MIPIYKLLISPSKSHDIKDEMPDDNGIELLTHLAKLSLELRISAVNDPRLRRSEQILDGDVERIDDDQRTGQELEQRHVFVDARDVHEFDGLAELHSVEKGKF